MAKDIIVWTKWQATKWEDFYQLHIERGLKYENKTKTKNQKNP